MAQTFTVLPLATRSGVTTGSTFPSRVPAGTYTLTFAIDAADAADATKHLSYTAEKSTDNGTWTFWFAGAWRGGSPPDPDYGDNLPRTLGQADGTFYGRFTVDSGDSLRYAVTVTV